MSTHLTVDEMQTMITRSSFNRLFAPEIVEADHDAGQLTVSVRMSGHLERQPGTKQWHGGALSAVVDIVGCYTLAMVVNDLCPTINFRIDYLRPAVETDLVAVGKIIQVGKSVGVVDVEVLNGDTKVVAVGRTTYSTRHPLGLRGESGKQD